MKIFLGDELYMISQLSWKIGGQQGEGLESTDRIFSTALNRLGYYLYGYRHFSSRIKGGHTNNKIRISTNPIRAISDDLDILVAFDQETIDLNARELRDGGVIIADDKFNPTIPEGIRCCSVSGTDYGDCGRARYIPDEEHGRIRRILGVARIADGSVQQSGRRGIWP